MIIGFTGTRKGMTQMQKEEVIRLIGKNDPDLVVHGDCIGADTDFHIICFQWNQYGRKIPIHIRPCNLRTRAYCAGADKVYDPKPPLVRDHEIVDDADLLIACSRTFTEEQRSGTWATIRYARRMKKHLIIILPNGHTQEENANAENLRTPKMEL